MAEIAIQVVASIGFSLLKAWLDPVQIEGPQTNTLDKPSSQYGDTINKIFGHSRCSGTLIWALNKVDKPYKQGQKGSETTVHAYYGNFAYLIGEGPLFLQVIYLNNKIWYSTAEDASQAQLKLNIERKKFFTFYEGNSTQLPDPRIQADLGINRTTAYRNYSYIVFKDLPLTEYGEAFPLPSFEVVSSASQVSVTQEKSGQIEGQSYTVTVAAYSNIGVQETFVAQVPNAVWGVRIMNVTPLTTAEGIRGEVQIYGKGYTKTIAAGSRWGKAGSGGPSNLQIVDIQPPGLAIPSLEANATSATGASSVAQVQSGQVYDYKIQWTRASDNSLQESIIRGEAPFVVKQGSLAVIDGFYKLIPRPATNAYFANPTSNQSLVGDRIYGINEQLAYQPGNPSNVFIEPLGILGIHGWQRVLSLPTAASVLIEPIDYSFAPLSKIATSIINLDSNTKLEAGSSASAGSPLNNVLQYVMTSCGLKPSQYDFSALSAKTIRGYRISSVKDGQSILEELQKIYLFSFYRDGGKLIGEPYGKILPFPPAHQNLFLVNENQSVYSELISDPEAMPGEFEITYLSKDLHLRSSSQRAYRYPSTLDYRILSNNLQTFQMQDKNLQKIAIDAVLSNSEALTLTHQMFSIILSRRNSHEWLWPLSMIGLTLNQVLDLDLPYSKTKQLVIVQSIDIGKNNSIVVRASSYDDSFKGIQLEAQTPTSTTVSAPGALSVNFVILDIPFWRAETHASTMYFAAYGEEWRGAEVFGSPDRGASFVSIGSITSESSVGTLLLPLNANISRDYIDESSVIRIKIKKGAAKNFVSINEAAFLDNATNLISINGEIAKFKNATLVGLEEYELSYLRRGLFGTKTEAGHVAGETVVLLDGAVNSIAAPVDQISVLQLIKVSPSGQDTANAVSTSVVPQGGSIKPLPVVNISSSWSTGYIEISWNRVARKNNPWVDYFSVPLVEAIEKYLIDIYSIGGDFKRTVSTSIQKFDYSTGDRIADIGADTSFIVEIFQLSDIVGRGFKSAKVIIV